MIFIPAFPDGEESNEALTEAGPLREQRRTIQEGRVHDVGTGARLEGSVISAKLVLNDLEEHLAGQEGTS